LAKSKLSANSSDYIRGEAAVLGYRTVTGNYNLLTILHCLILLLLPFYIILNFYRKLLGFNTGTCYPSGAI